ncbi:MAG: hypothetical protein HUU23_04765 [Caldilineales bacterium]|nr:hypothetical protein [Caldilineales bacterium]
MTAYTLRFSTDPIVMLPADLAQRAGLQEGLIQVIPGEARLTVAAMSPESSYADRWQHMAAALREQAAAYDPALEDRRDDAYWSVVDTLWADAERWIGSG